MDAPGLCPKEEPAQDEAVEDFNSLRELQTPILEEKFPVFGETLVSNADPAADLFSKVSRAMCETSQVNILRDNSDLITAVLPHGQEVASRQRSEKVEFHLAAAQSSRLKENLRFASI